MIEIKRKGQTAAQMPAERAQMLAEGLDAQARGDTRTQRRNRLKT